MNSLDCAGQSEHIVITGPKHLHVLRSSGPAPVLLIAPDTITWENGDTWFARTPTLPWPQSAFSASPVDLVGSPAGAAAPQTTVPASGTPCAVDTLLATCRRLLADLSTSDAGELAERIGFLLRNECQAPGCYRDAIATLVMELFTGFAYIPRVN